MSGRQTNPQLGVFANSQVEELRQQNKNLLARSRFNETTIINHMRDLVIAGRTTSNLDEKEWFSATARFWSGKLYFNTGRELVPLVYTSDEPDTNLTGAKESSGVREISAAASVRKLLPLGDRILLKEMEQERTLASGLVISDTAYEKPKMGQVVAVGPGRFDESGNRMPMDVKVGDRVLYARHTGQEIPRGVLGSEEEEFIVIKESDILASLA